MSKVALNGKYAAYPEYKDSGVEWLGEIPNHWRVVPIKYLADLNPRKSAIDRTLLNKECNFLPMEKLKLNSIILDEKRLVSDVYDGYTYFEDGDVLMAKVTPCFENKNIAVASGLVNGVGFGSSEIYVLRSNEKTDNRFLYYRLQEDSFMDIATAAMTGAGGLKRVPSEVVNGYSLGTPEAEEQTQIANFLDHETAKIDTLIEKQQQLIKLLKEKRQAVISHAVTKGLNPQAPMRDSGVEWLGEVPEHWVVSRLGFHTLKIGSGKTPKGGAEVYQKEGVLFLRSQNVYDDGLRISESESVYISESIHDEMRTTKVFGGDILLNITGGSIGRTCLVPFEFIEANVNQHVCIIRLPDCLREFISMTLKSTPIKEQIGAIQTGGNREGLNFEQISKFSIALPPESERNEIVQSVKTSLAKLDALEEQSNRAIKLMQERRTALISAAVTGKIDVRNWQAPTSQNQELEQTA